LVISYIFFIHRFLNEQKCCSAHSLHFLAWLDKLAKILDKDDTIQFSIKEDHPMKVEIDFTKLGDTSLLYFLAPRGIIEDIDEEFDENLDDF